MYRPFDLDGLARRTLHQNVDQSARGSRLILNVETVIPYLDGVVSCQSWALVSLGTVFMLRRTLARCNYTEDCVEFTHPR